MVRYCTEGWHILLLLHPPSLPRWALDRICGHQVSGTRVFIHFSSPHLFYTALASGTENCLICSSKFGGEGAQMLVVWGQRVPLGACSCRSQLLPSHVTLSACQCLLLPIWQTTSGLLPHLTTSTVFVGSQKSNCCSFCRNTKNFPK